MKKGIFLTEKEYKEITEKKTSKTYLHNDSVLRPLYCRTCNNCHQNTPAAEYCCWCGAEILDDLEEEF